jgi:hypothetical protein
MSAPKNPTKSGGGKWLWIVVAIFVVQIGVWAAWITFASKHRVAEVPLTTGR